MSSKGKLLLFVMVWLVLFGIGAVAWKYLAQPQVEKVVERRNQARLSVGSSDSRYDHRLNLALDSFSGYAILRSKEFADELGNKSIKINLIDDGADYTQRIDGIKSGQTQMAVFTIDALLKTSAQVQDLPASIVAMIDETRGADAMVGFKKRFQSIDDFNDPSVEFVLTPDSPSETLARVVMTHFALPRLAQDPIVKANDAKDVYERYRKSSPTGNQVFVLWEPYVSKMLENPNVHTIISSRDLFGYIVDVLVVSRDYLRTNEAVVRDVVECYFRAAYQHQPHMNKLVLADAKLQGEALTPQQADRLVNGVQWKNTQRNYAHFGITENHAVQHIEDMIENITSVLVATSAISADPTSGQPNLLYYDAILRDLEGEKFHPAGQGQEIDDSIQLRALTEREWDNLAPVGTLRVPQLVFARGTSKLLEGSRNTLQDLANTLQTQQYYVKITGVATRRGDLDLNQKLAAERAQAAADNLISQGVAAERIQTTQPELGDVPSVTFSLGQVPY